MERNSISLWRGDQLIWPKMWPSLRCPPTIFCKHCFMVKYCGGIAAPHPKANLHPPLRLHYSVRFTSQPLKYWLRYSTCSDLLADQSEIALNGYSCRPPWFLKKLPSTRCINFIILALLVSGKSTLIEIPLQLANHIILKICWRLCSTALF